MRVSFDLDEVLFVDPKRFETEKPPRFPMSLLFPERLRKGTVDLVHQLQKEGFEVWVYTSSFRSESYIKSLFRNYGVRFDDIVNGFRHQAEVQRNRRQTLPTKVPSHYHISLHVDDEEAVIRNGREFGFKVMRVYEPDEHWADKILEEARRIRAREEAESRKA
jgi:hypothetical protein